MSGAVATLGDGQSLKPPIDIAPDLVLIRKPPPHHYGGKQDALGSRDKHWSKKFPCYLPGSSKKAILRENSL
jgi:hypothetical protein